MTATLPDRPDERSDPCHRHADRRAVDPDALSHASNRRPREADRRDALADQRDERSDPCQLVADRAAMLADHAGMLADHASALPERARRSLEPLDRLERATVLSKPSTCSLVVRAGLGDELPEFLRVIHAPEVHQLVDHHVVANPRRHADQSPVQANVGVWRTRSPAPPLIAYADF
jgi:hypothetical protein